MGKSGRLGRRGSRAQGSPRMRRALPGLSGEAGVLIRAHSRFHLARLPAEVRSPSHPNGDMTMTLRSAQKILICRTALALAAVLLHSVTAISAESADNGHAQARALLSGAADMRMNRTSTALPATGLAAFAHDPQDQA